MDHPPQQASLLEPVPFDPLPRQSREVETPSFAVPTQYIPQTHGAQSPVKMASRSIFILQIPSNHRGRVGPVCPEVRLRCSGAPFPVRQRTTLQHQTLG